MPQLGQYQYLLDCAFFLYPDEISAEEGRGAGGTGFFVTVPSECSPDLIHHLYAVSNWHVAVSGGNSVLRLNRQDGKQEIIATEPHEWEFSPHSHDLAVFELDLDSTQIKAEALSAPSFFLNEQNVAAWEVNAGEDVFMLGRFVDYEGRDTNAPAMRFGNISMMQAKIEQPTGFTGPSIVVDMHSRTGFSGSPVFVYRTPGSVFPKEDTLLIRGHMMNLLGVLWGQFPESWDLVNSEKSEMAVLDGKSVKGWSGMSFVCPSWALWDLLHSPKLVSARQAKEAEWTRA